MSGLIRQTTTRASVNILLAVMLCAFCAGTSYPQPPARTARPSSTPGCCLPATTTQWESNRGIYQEFPAQGPSETAWAIIWSENGNKGLWIEGAWFWRKRPFTAQTVIQVLGRAGLSNIFVPYHDNWNRFEDLRWGELLGAIPQDAGACGAITDPLLPSPKVVNPPELPPPPRRVLIKEIRDRGVAWTKHRRTRRGEEMLLWATYDGGGYEFIMQYGFRDDGTITFRLGSTGYNHPNRPFTAHSHDALWRVDINLGGWDNDSVKLMRHLEPDPPASWTASDSMTLFNNGLEGFADWKDEEFTALHVMDTQITNAQGKEIGYDLMPMRTGIARHVEDFSKHDFWVTEQNSNEMEYTTGFEGWCGMVNPPQCYIIPPQTVTDPVLWHMTSSHHLPRDEDHEYLQPIRVPGVALVMWSGFDLHPRNFFDSTPLHEPPCAAVPSSLVGWWPLDDAAGSATVVDINASGGPGLNNGTSQPASLGSGGPVPVSGAVGGVLAFDGVDDYVEIPDNAALNFGTGDFSVDAWIKTTQNSGVRVILDKRFEAGSASSGSSGQKSKQPASQVGSTPTGYHLYLDNGKPGVQLAYGGSHFNYASNTSVADGNWHHLAVTVNRTGSNVPATKEILWYVDGLLVDTNPLPALTGSLDNTSPLRLAVRSSSLSGYWNGVLDELELFNNVLSGSDIFTIYAAGRAGKCR